MRTRRFDTLTYAKSGAEAEDITLFDRKRHHNIALYPSKDKLARAGRFYNEDDLGRLRHPRLRHRRRGDARTGSGSTARAMRLNVRVGCRSAR